MTKVEKVTVVQVSAKGWRVRSTKGHFISRIVSRKKAEQQAALINRISGAK